jgi:hypothetical protein
MVGAASVVAAEIPHHAKARRLDIRRAACFLLGPQLAVVAVRAF